MKVLEYPLICWNLNENAIYGQLVGFAHQLVADDLRSLKSGFSDYIQKLLKNEEFYEPDIRNAKIKSYTLNVRPHYRQEERIYPIQETVNVPVTAVYGGNEYGYYECFLPLLGKSFYFYNEADLEKLVEHFSRDIFHSMEPGEIYSLLLPTPPFLENVNVKVPKIKNKGGAVYDYGHSKFLSGIAERLPYSRKEAKSLLPDMTWERGALVDQLINTLLQEKSNVLLVGRSGVGKTAIINEAIRKVTSQEKNKEAYERHSFWRSSASRMTAKAKYLGEWQLICEDMVQELQRVKGILWVENFVMLATTGGEGPEDSVAAFLASFIQRGYLRLISEVSQEQLEVMRRLLPGFVENFRLIHVEEMDTSATLRIFGYFDEYTSKNLSISFDNQAIEMAYSLLDRFIRYQSFPGKAIHFLYNCVNLALQSKVFQLDQAFIIRTFSVQSGIPGFLLRDDQLLYDADLKAFFKERIKGQDHILDRICSVIKIFKAGLNDPNKPISTMIFAGPTGVGKTATAKAISQYFFGIGQKYEPMVRLDMSEFQHPAQIYRLIGSEGKLIRHVREKPFSVVLLDEIEKAHPLIFDALLTLMDEGILIDASGRMTDFRNTIIIMTSNLGSTQKSSLGFRSYQGQDYESDIRAFFKPEFFNRIDSCLIFNPLDEDTIRLITSKELDDIENREGIKERGLKLQFTQELLRHVAAKGFDIKYGARPLQREIERLVVAPLARLLISDTNFKNKTVTVDFEEGEVVFKR